MQKTTRLNRLLAAIVAVFMVVCCLPLNAFAEPVDKAVVTVNYVADGEVEGSEQIEVGFEAATKTATISMSKLKEMLKNKPAGYDFDESQANDTFTVSIDKFELSTGWSASKAIEVKIVKPVQKTITVIFNWLNPDSTTATDTAKLTAENNLAPVPTVVSPDGKKFVGWHQDAYQGGSDLPANTATISYGELSKLLEGETGTDLYVTFTAKYEDIALNKINVSYYIDGKEAATPANVEIGTDGNVTLPTTVNEGICPDGQELKGWYLNGVTDDFYAAGTSLSFAELAAKLDAYDTSDGENGVGYAGFTPVFGKKTYDKVQKIIVTFNKNGVTYGGSFEMTANSNPQYLYTEVIDGTCPDNMILDGWLYQGDSTDFFNIGSKLTFSNMAAKVGENFNKEDGTATINFTPSFVGAVNVCVNFFDEKNYEQVAEQYITVPDGTNEIDPALVMVPYGYKSIDELDQPLKVNDGNVYVGVECTKYLNIFWSINGAEATYVGHEDKTDWTQTQAWKHVNDEITLPKINIPDGYYLKGWTVNGQESESWSADTKTVNLGEKYYFDPDDQNGTGMIAITALLEKKPSSGDSDSDSSSSSDNNSNNNNSNSNNNNTKTVSSNNNQVVKADAPADNTAKIMPQTGLSVETPVVFGVMMVAALAGAGAYLFAIRKKLN